jgi:hypothetical protein
MAVQRSKDKARRLIAVANELLTLAHDLERTAEDDAGSAGEGSIQGDDPLWGELARQTYEDRRRRTKIFGDETLFGEPAWDILLDLFIAAKERRRVYVTSACIGAAVPATTALRWITILEQKGFVVRDADPGDARRTFVRLSAHGYAAMIEYFQSASRTTAPFE